MYDRDEVLLIHSWFLESGDALLEGLRKSSLMVAMPAVKKAAPTKDMAAMKVEPQSSQ
jgi:hypothetical protein